jgi:hypothetical protein
MPVSLSSGLRARFPGFFAAIQRGAGDPPRVGPPSGLGGGTSACDITKVCSVSVGPAGGV